MNNLYMRKFLLIVFIPFLVIGSCYSVSLHADSSIKADIGMPYKALGVREIANDKEPRAVRKAKKKQSAKEKKMKKDYAKSVKRSQKRTIEIQTPEVQARMKQNQKDSQSRDKNKKKKIKASTKKAGKKYK